MKNSVFFEIKRTIKGKRIIFENMIRAAQTLFFLLLTALAEIALLTCCTPRKTGSYYEEPKKEFPKDMSLSPSWFRCETKVLGMDSLQSTLLISRIIQQGSALFYTVGNGDTIQAKIYSYQRHSLLQDSTVEIVIEERLKMNSEKPDFIVREIKSLQK